MLESTTVQVQLQKTKAAALPEAIQMGNISLSVSPLYGSLCLRMYNMTNDKTHTDLCMQLTGEQSQKCKTDLAFKDAQSGKTWNKLNVAPKIQCAK